MSVLSKVLGIFGKKEAPKAEAAAGGKAAAKQAAKVSAKPAGKVVGKSSGKPAGKVVGKTADRAAVAPAPDDPRAAVKARNKAARKARKRNQA